MKKGFILLFLLMTVLLALPALAGSPTEFGIPKVGTEINGFVVKDVYNWEEYLTDVVTLEHIKTGSVLLWLANDNIERNYTIAFRTPVYGNTGIAHVFEHATLGGNTKYPGANTFFEMDAKTSNTYLNASTYSDNTRYIMSSTSEDQLIQYIDYYMSGLTEPLAISNPYAMMREAYRYELDSPEDDITLQGVVYSEMLGALTQERMAYYNYLGMMWPGSYVASISGGEPEHIPELTIEQLRAFHEEHYHPSNATMFLSGDLNLPHILDLLNTQFLSQYDRREIAFDDPNYTPVTPGYHETVFPYPAEEGTPTENAAILYYGHPFDASTATYEELATLDYVTSYLNDESSPFMQTMREKLPGASAYATFSCLSGRKTDLLFVANGLNESDKDLFRSICDESLAQVLKDGVNEDVLNAILTSKRFSRLMSLDNSSIYRSLSNDIYSSQQSYNDLYIWKKEAEFNRALERHITADNLNQVAQKYWSQLGTSVMAITVPEPGLKEKNDAELRQHLNEMKASMTPEDISALVERTKAYHAFVEESSQIVMPDSLNALTVSSLPEEVPHKVASETTLGGIRLVTSEVDSPLIRIALINNAAVIPFEDLLDYMEFTSLLGQLGTDLYSRVELPSKFSLTTTGVSLMDSDAFEILKTHEVKFKAETHWFTLPDLLEDSFALIEHILYHTDFSDYDFIRNDAARRVANYTNSLSDSSLNIGLNAAMFPFSDSVKINHYLNGYEFIRYLDKVSKMSDSELDALTAKFEHFRDLVLNRNGAVLAIMGNGENILRASALGYHLISKFDDAEHETLDYAALIPDTPRNLAIVTGGNVVYNLVMTNLEEAGFDRTDGGLDIIEGLLDDKLLYPELRVKNSAYGGYSLKEAYILGLYSYRDPKVTETYQIYGQAADFLRNLSISEKELEGYQISAYSYVNPPAGPLSIALTGIMDQIYHRETVAEKIRTIRDIKAFTPADIARYGALLDRFGTDESTRVTAGSKSLIESAPDLFSRISYDLINFTGEDAGE